MAVDELHKTGGIAPLSIEKELKSSFLDYAMSVIVSRALPDVRDGLKPVHRRILYAMHTQGLYAERAYRKSATVVGEVMGNYHPHGDQAIYQSMVTLAQDFGRRYPVLDGQGNWGSIDGDNAASMRYTEVRMAKIAQELLADIEKETVDFVPNFDESRREPSLLPSKIPHLLLNGANGIAVGMATSIPPHNLGELLDGCMALMKNPHLSEEELFAMIPAPDFPTGGIICGRAGILKAYRTGHGSVKLRAVVDIQEDSNRASLIVTEMPYQVNKADLITKIADLVKNKVIDGISNIRDESSSRGGIRLVIELKRGEIPQVTLNQLYKHTALQTSISILLLAIHNNRPLLFTLREMLEHFIAHRREVVTKRTEFDLKKCQARAHILQGLIIALENIDPIITLIKAAPDSEAAQGELVANYKLTPVQAKAILEMRLSRLTGLERGKIMNEMHELQQKIQELRLILTDRSVLDGEIFKEMQQIRETYGDTRRTRIEHAVDALSEADLIPDEEVVVTLTRKGYMKRVILDTYTVQRRGGKGKKGMADLGDSDDVMQDIFVTKNHDELLFFTNLGRVYSLKVFQVPEGSRTAKGRAVVNLLPLVEGERVVKLLCTRDMEGKFLVMCTRNGTIKKTDAMAFSKIRSTGIRAVGLNDGDELVFCGLSNGDNTIVIATRNGQGIQFHENEVRAMGRQAAGVRGIRLKDGDIVVGLVVVSPDSNLLFATSRGYGKRVRVEDFRVAHRGGVGVRTIPTTTRNGQVIGLVTVTEESQILLIDK
ncbi:MAG: DNA gyrase subunit A, partial [Candidatus Dependentiae bacterium]